MPEATSPINEICLKCQSSETIFGQGYIKVSSYYLNFLHIGVGHLVRIVPSAGAVVEQEVRLPVGSEVSKIYGPFVAGSATVTVTPLINHQKSCNYSNNQCHASWTEQVQVPLTSRVSADFIFLETDTWDRTTTARINLLHPSQRDRFLVFINKVEEDTGYQFRVANGIRTAAEQDSLYCNSRKDDQYCIDLGLPKGNTDGKWKTSSKRWQSYHNYGLAVDIYRFDAKGTPVNPDENTNTVAAALDLTWGNTFKTADPPHFQWGSYSWSDLKKKLDAGESFEQVGQTYVTL